MSVHIIGDQRGLMKAGTMEPSGYGHITSIDRFTVEANKKYAPDICRQFESILGIPAKRCNLYVALYF